MRHRFGIATLAALAVVGTVGASVPSLATSGSLPRLKHHQPKAVVDLGVGLWSWPLPMDYNRDGRIDLVVATTGVPGNGIWFFENSGERDAGTRLPLFKPPIRVGTADSPTRPRYDPQISYVRGEPIVTTPGFVHPRFREAGFTQGVALPASHVEPPRPGSVRFRQPRFIDYDGDDRSDLIVGLQYGGDYGAAGSYDREGRWKGGPLRGYVYLVRNAGTEAAPKFEPPLQLSTTDGKPIDVYGQPSPCFADFRGTGKLDLICGEFLDGFTFFENVGTRSAPRYAPGRPLTSGGQPIKMHLCMTTPVAVDFDDDGDPDLVVGDEDGRVAFIENTGKVADGLPQFLAPRYFRQYADDVKFGALSSPVSVDWDGDGRDDLIAGNSAGNVGFIRNLGGTPLRWAPPVLLSAGGKPIHEQAGTNGSIQGPNEAKWGYTNVGVGDWDGDGLPDLITNGVWGRVLYFRNIGTRTQPSLAAAEPIEVAWQGQRQWPQWNWWAPRGNELVTQWRTTPCIIDWNRDGLNDLVTLDYEGYLVCFERQRDASGKRILLPPRRIFHGATISAFDSHGKPRNDQPGLLRLNDADAKSPGRAGRRTFCFGDWDGDGVLDLIVNSQPGASLLRGVGRTTDGLWSFAYAGPLHQQVLAGHSTTPTLVDWDRDGIHDLLIAAEDGFFYQLQNPRARPAHSSSTR